MFVLSTEMPYPLTWAERRGGLVFSAMHSQSGVRHERQGGLDLAQVPEALLLLLTFNRFS